MVLALVLVIGYVVQAARDTTEPSAGTPPTGAVGYAVPAGPASAPVKVAVYEDFLCPFCGQFEAASRDRAAEAGRRRQGAGPATTCSTSSTAAPAPSYSSRAANALAVVLDASGPEVAKKFHDLLFENQPAEGSAGPQRRPARRLAVQAGATEADVQPGIEDRTFEQWVKNGTDQASKDGVNGTPDGARSTARRSRSRRSAQLVAAVDKAAAGAVLRPRRSATRVGCVPD